MASIAGCANKLCKLAEVDHRVEDVEPTPDPELDDDHGSRAVRFSVTYPLLAHSVSPDVLTQPAITRFARTAEAAGFDGISFTDHPAPTHRLLSAGGHDALDPFGALSFCAAVTERLRLIPNILVLPYRNPFLVAKAVAGLDALSNGTSPSRSPPASCG